MFVSIREFFAMRKRLWQMRRRSRNAMYDQKFRASQSYHREHSKTNASENLA